MIIRAAVLVVIAVVLYFGLPKHSRADPVYAADAGNGVRVVVHSDPCAIKTIANLPKRATYHDKGKVFEGCVGLSPELQIFIFYFEDMTVVAVPLPYFERVSGA